MGAVGKCEPALNCSQLDVCRQYASVILPLALQNAVNDYVNCEQATTLGDVYSTRTTLLLVGATNALSALFGNPFPGCIFVGHAGDTLSPVSHTHHLYSIQRNGCAFGILDC